MKKKYLPLYKKWSKTGRMPKRGLCPSISDRGRMQRIFKPEWAGAYSFWACDDLCERYDYIAHGFNPLRQNIVLLMSALNNEL